MLLAFLIHQATRPADAGPDRGRPEIRPVQLVFAPPRPTPTPRAAPPEIPPPTPLTEGPDQTPGTTAQLSRAPEEEPNSAPNTPRVEAFRPDPGESDQAEEEAIPAPPPAIAAPTTTASNAQPALESEARRIFGRPSSKLGPLAGQRDNRPWETPVELNSRGCTLPPPNPEDSLPPGMAAVAGRIYNERTGDPLAGARLQILGTPYGTFSDGTGRYRLVFDRSLVSQCRSQAVRVSAPGYRGRDVLLYLGNVPNGDVPLSRY